MKQSSRTRLSIGFLCYLISCAVVIGVMIAWPEARLVRMALAGGALILTLAFMLTYHIGTRGDWRKSDIGVHLMVFGLTNAIVLTLVVISFLGWLPIWLGPAISAATYLTIGWLFGWRTVIMDGYLHAGPPTAPDPEPDEDADDYRNGYPPHA
jgi:hypothetical protein